MWTWSTNLFREPASGAQRLLATGRCGHAQFGRLGPEFIVLNAFWRRGDVDALGRGERPVFCDVLNAFWRRGDVDRIPC